MEQQTILIVDDEVINIDILVELLAQDYDIRVAMNGASALEEVQRSKPDLILLDIIMPGISGLDVCKLLKSSPDTSDIPIIFITVRDKLQEELTGFELGAADYIHKPFQPPIVRARVKTHLALSDQRHALKSMVQERTEQLERALEAARGASKAKDAFLDNMSHELRTPLNGIIGATQVLMEQDLPDEYKEYLGLAYRSAMSLLDILERLLELSSLIASSAPFKTTEFTLREVIFPLLEGFAVQAREKGLGFSWTIDQSIPEKLVGNPTRLRQLLEQILHNALRFTLSGEITVEVLPSQDCLIPVMRAQGSDIAILARITDTGTGIPDHLQEHIFDPFTMGEPHMTKQLSGTGLGLALAKVLAERLGGRIWMRSKQGEGSTFNIALPFTPAGEE